MLDQVDQDVERLGSSGIGAPARTAVMRQGPPDVAEFVDRPVPHDFITLRPQPSPIITRPHDAGGPWGAPSRGEVFMCGCLVLLTVFALGSHPLTIDERGGVIVEARLNGAGPFKFMVDTGASRSIVADDLARPWAPGGARSEVAAVRVLNAVRGAAWLCGGGFARVECATRRGRASARLSPLGTESAGFGADFLSRSTIHSTIGAAGYWDEA